MRNQEIKKEVNTTRGDKMLKTKKTVVKVTEKKLSEKKSDSVLNLLTKNRCEEKAERSRTYQAVGYFLKHKPVMNKVYNVAEILPKGFTSSLKVFGSHTVNNIEACFKREIETIKKSENGKVISFKFIK